jgi:ectoine hydroxylase-related dioxygenase (phytanoyl-CoA dioxygenase family)
VRTADGTLCFVPGSHRWSGFDRPTPRTAQVPAEFTARLRSQCSRPAHAGKAGKAGKAIKATQPPPDGVTWHAAEFQPGDVVIFNIKTVHAASKNNSECFRLR